MTLIAVGRVLSKTGLMERLLEHRTLGGAPRGELEWLVDHGELRRFEPGDVIAPHSEIMVEMVVMVTGHLAHYVDRGPERRKIMEWRGGDVTGLLPYSRLTYPPGNSVVEASTDGVIIHRDHFPELIRECPTVTSTLVHAMLDRARHFVSTDWQDEKVMSLGRLAAGLAHELNNPASAVASSAKALGGAFAEAEQAAHALGAAQLTAEERTCVDAIRTGSLIPATTGIFSALERSDREDDLTEWLEAHDVDTNPADVLADSGIGVDALDQLADALSGEALNVAIRSIAAGFRTRSLVWDIERAASRIYDLVSAVKRFTYMDRGTVSVPTRLAQNLSDTVSVLSSKAKTKSVAIALDIPDNLPLVNVYVAELNQVWANLLENALDAVPPSGKIVMSAQRDRDHVIVRIVDNGSGIPAEIQKRIFDPFFTTKEIGQGTGLGLDISQRIVKRHGGTIDVESRPGHTEFRVRLPIEGPPGT
jgi:signal transduction histidine kinase